MRVCFPTQDFHLIHPYVLATPPVSLINSGWGTEYELFSLSMFFFCEMRPSFGGLRGLLLPHPRPALGTRDDQFMRATALCVMDTHNNVFVYRDIVSYQTNTYVR